MKRWEEADLSKKPQNSEISLEKGILRYSASVNGGVRYRGEGERERREHHEQNVTRNKTSWPQEAGETTPTPVGG